MKYIGATGETASPLVYGSILPTWIWIKIQLTKIKADPCGSGLTTTALVDSFLCIALTLKQFIV
jgi:hypothetical protein